MLVSIWYTGCLAPFPVCCDDVEAVPSGHVVVGSLPSYIKIHALFQLMKLKYGGKTCVLWSIYILSYCYALPLCTCCFTWVVSCDIVFCNQHQTSPFQHPSVHTPSLSPADANNCKTAPKLGLSVYVKIIVVWGSQFILRFGFALPWYCAWSSVILSQYCLEVQIAFHINLILW